MANNGEIPELTNGAFDEFIKKGMVFIDFFAEWCMPCLTMAPIIDELKDKFEEKIKFGKVNISDDEELARKFNVSSIPNFIIFKDGKVVDNFGGTMDSEELENRLMKFAK